MHRTIARLIWYLKRCKTILVIFLKNLGIISQTNSSSLSSRQALAVTKLCCRKPPTQGKVNKIYQQGGVSCLLAVIRQVRSTDNWWEVVFMALMNLLSHFYYMLCIHVRNFKSILILRFVIYPVTCLTDILRIILCIWIMLKLSVYKYEMKS